LVVHNDFVRVFLGILLVIGVPQLIAFAVLRLRRVRPIARRLLSLAAAFLASVAVVLAAARLELGRPFEEAQSPEYGPFVLVAGVAAGIVNVGIALLPPLPRG
jgi:hypothetical protein